MAFRATLNFQKSCLSNVDDIKKFYRAVFELQAPEAVIKGVFSKSYCCCGNLLGYEKDNNVLTNSGVVF